MDREPNLSDNYGLQELGGSDFEIADHEPDIRGWTIKDNQGRTIGEVDELIFDPQSRKVRYIVMDLEGNVLDLEPRDVLVPIGMAELHESDDDVILPGVTADQLRVLPLYEKGRITRDIENSVRSAFAGAGAAAASAGAAIGRAADKVGDALTPDRDRERFYEHEHFDEKKFYRNRPGSIDRESRITERKTMPPTTGTTPGATTRPDSTTMGTTTTGTPSTGTPATGTSGMGTTGGSASTGTGSGTPSTGTTGTSGSGMGTTGGSGTTGSSGMGTGTSGSGSSGMGTTGTGSASTGTPGTGTSGTSTGRTNETGTDKPHIET